MQIKTWEKERIKRRTSQIHTVYHSPWPLAVYASSGPIDYAGIHQPPRCQYMSWLVSRGTCHRLSSNVTDFYQMSPTVTECHKFSCIDLTGKKFWMSYVIKLHTMAFNAIAGIAMHRVRSPTKNLMMWKATDPILLTLKSIQLVIMSFVFLCQVEIFAFFKTILVHAGDTFFVLSFVEQK